MLDTVYDNGLDVDFIKRLQNHEHLKIDPVTLEEISDEKFQQIMAICKKYPLNSEKNDVS